MMYNNMYGIMIRPLQIMLKNLPIILFLYSQKLCPLFFSKLPIILKLFSKYRYSSQYYKKN